MAYIVPHLKDEAIEIHKNTLSKSIYHIWFCICTCNISKWWCFWFRASYNSVFLLFRSISRIIIWNMNFTVKCILSITCLYVLLCFVVYNVFMEYILMCSVKQICMYPYLFNQILTEHEFYGKGHLIIDMSPTEICI